MTPNHGDLCLPRRESGQGEHSWTAISNGHTGESLGEIHISPKQEFFRMAEQDLQTFFQEKREVQKIIPAENTGNGGNKPALKPLHCFSQIGYRIRTSKTTLLPVRPGVVYSATTWISSAASNPACDASSYSRAQFGPLTSKIRPIRFR